MFGNIFSRAKSWGIRWIDANITLGSILGKSKRKRNEQELEGIKKQPTPSPVTNTHLLNQQRQLNRIKEFVETLPANKSPVYYWAELVNVLQELGRQEETLEIGKYYTFRYWAKTRGKYFDAFPVSIIIGKSARSYLGVNLHWKNAPNYVESMYRTYIWSGFQSRFYEIKEWELEYVMRIPTFYPIKL